MKHLNKIIVAIISLSLILMMFLSSFDQKGTQIIDNSFTQAMVVFGTAKALNGVISLAQGTEVGPPGVTVSIGEVLDPINDLVEQFSWVMLASMTSLGIQKILMNIFTSTFFDTLFIATLLILNIWLFYRFKNDGQTHDLFFKFAIVLVFLRFSVPLMAIANELTYTNFVQQEYNIEVLESDIGVITESVKKTDPKNSSWSSLFNTEEYSKKVEQYTQAADQASSRIIHLIIAFVFQTIVFPLIFLFFLYQLIRKIFAFGA